MSHRTRVILGGIAGALLMLIVALAGSLSAAALLGLVAVSASMTLQPILQAWNAGLTLSIEDRLDVGDEITTPGPAGPFRGVVTLRDLRATEIRSVDGDVLIQPNTALIGAFIKHSKETPCTSSSQP